MSKEKQSTKEPLHITLLIGNPGTGKSALLNSLTGGAHFKSGISIGRGVTQKLQFYKQTDQEWFADTPGFDDVEIRKDAAAEIEKALKQGAVYTICFVVTLESGRLRPSDLSTMQLILDSVKRPDGISVKYGIIVNKIEKEVYKLIKEPENYMRLYGQLNGGSHFTDYLFLNGFDERLQAKSDIVAPRNMELETFLKLLPRNAIKVGDVQSIDYDKMKRLCEEYEEKTQKLMKDNENLQAQLIEFLERSKKFESQLTDVEKENRKLAQNLAKNERGYVSQLGAWIDDQIQSSVDVLKSAGQLLGEGFMKTPQMEIIRQGLKYVNENASTGELVKDGVNRWLKPESGNEPSDPKIAFIVKAVNTWL